METKKEIHYEVDKSGLAGDFGGCRQWGWCVLTDIKRRRIKGYGYGAEYSKSRKWNSSGVNYQAIKSSPQELDLKTS